MDTAEIQRLIEARIEGARAEVQSPDGVHFQARVVAEAFQGKPMLEQHRMVKDVLKDQFESGEVHALSLRTLTPEQAARQSQG